ncbi:DUF1116 domain-containing protein [Pseudodesulfovibrio sp. JC047]|uniref:DUF1116 domain-containing protein n=1 Tax=Pseudodesulfovibrio sp. JC047 TaxID=2683199 RepID=UPI0013D64705|nr:DUF1116 domain-containing protein [Pseudodesulfovibrio sp. JC047]NDV18565.1 DUF1116 domain-containing protein [Pseudodesulfovibrio sp. JC047]
MKNLISDTTNVLNVGLPRFRDALSSQGVPVSNCTWQPPAGGEADRAWKLAKTLSNPAIDAANKIAFSRYMEANPVLVGVGTAGKDIPGMDGKRILHSGPPIAWENMCGPQQGAVMGAILFEGWATTPEAAAKMVESGDVTLAPCHHHQAVGPMAGVISPSMPVWIVRNEAHGNYTYCNFNEGLGKVLRFGAFSKEVLDRLHWMADVLAPVVSQAVKHMEPLEIKPLMAQALHMGDEVHNRNAAATSMFFRKLAPAALKSDMDPAKIAEALTFIAGNDHFFLNLSMASCKSMMDAAAGVENSSMVICMARNGVEFGVRISAFPDTWFTADAPMVDGLFFPGYGKEDAAADLGDSAITETAGVGGFAMAAAPAIVQFVGGTVADAVKNSRTMQRITVGRNGAFTLPLLDFGGSAAGIDCRKVVDTGIQPIINTGIAHKEAGIGQIGAGLTAAPMDCFTQAIDMLDARLSK